MLCAPLLLDCFIMLILMIREASQLLIEVKTLELKKKKEREKKKGNTARDKKEKSKKDD